MINIISKSVISGEISGPGKVVNNLIKGLDSLGYPYCINKALDSTSQLWIHDDTNALAVASKSGLKAVIGPNLYVMPRNIPPNLDLSKFVYIHPSKWVIDLWKHFGFSACPIVEWPVGVDTELFKKRQNPNNGKVLIYFKQRLKEELDFIERLLREKGIKYDLVSYGSYDQSDYLEKLKNTKYMIWLGKTESQGLALEEALSMNVPTLVWDVSHLGHYAISKNEPFNSDEMNYKNVTSAYYFDDRCGLKTKNRGDIEKYLSKMESEWTNFEPRKYIIENLSLEKQAKAFIELFNKYYNISYEAGKNESMKYDKDWSNNSIYFKSLVFLKDKIKRCVKLLRK